MNIQEMKEKVHAIDIRESYDLYTTVQPVMREDTKEVLIHSLTDCEVCGRPCSEEYSTYSSERFFGETVVYEAYECLCDKFFGEEG